MKKSYFPVDTRLWERSICAMAEEQELLRIQVNNPDEEIVIRKAQRIREQFGRLSTFFALEQDDQPESSIADEEELAAMHSLRLKCHP
ncbi:MAG: hypothetical protein ABSA97_05365 [Verrucomicrobiia bacterium]